VRDIFITYYAFLRPKQNNINVIFDAEFSYVLIRVFAGLDIAAEVIITIFHTLRAKWKFLSPSVPLRNYIKSSINDFARTTSWSYNEPLNQPTAEFILREKYVYIMYKFVHVSTYFL